VIARIAPTLRNALALVVIPLAAVAGVIALRASGAGTTISAYDILLRASHSYDGLAATLGPNTTLHEVDVVHGGSPPDLPPDYRTDTWVVFGADGRAIRAEAVTTAADGTTYKYFTGDGSQALYTDGTNDQPKIVAFHPGSLSEWRKAIEAVVLPGPRLPQLPVTTGMLDGQRVYVIHDNSRGPDHRTFIDQSTYRPLLEEDVSPLPGLRRDGSVVVLHSEQVMSEVLPGDAAPPAADLATYGQRPARR
jgi:hypothetical protein